MQIVDAGRLQGKSHLFLLRLWADTESSDGAAWQARLQHVLTGEACAIEPGSELVAALLALLDSPGARQHPEPDKDE